MRKIFYCSCVLIFAANCSSPSNTQSDLKSAETNTVANVNKTVVLTTNQTNENVSLPIANANSTNANAPFIRDSSINKRNADLLRQGKGGGKQENIPIADKIGKVSVPAPDNSEVSSSMNAKGQPQETRTFKNNPQLIKVERIDLDNRNVKVYLKNGKVLTMPEDRAGDFLTASAAEILQAVGVK